MPLGASQGQGPQTPNPVFPGTIESCLNNVNLRSGAGVGRVCIWSSVTEKNLGENSKDGALCHEPQALCFQPHFTTWQ